MRHRTSGIRVRWKYKHKLDFIGLSRSSPCLSKKSIEWVLCPVPQVPLKRNANETQADFATTPLGETNVKHD